MRKMTPRFALLLAATSLIGAATPSSAQDAPSPQAPGSEGRKPGELPAPHNDLPPVPAPPGAVFPGAKPKPQAAKPVPQDRDALLSELYTHLAKTHDATEAAPIAETIEGLWLQSGSDTIGLLMGRSAKAINEQKNDLALQLLDAVVELAPAYAEGWNRRAYVYFLQNNFEGAVGDLRRALALEPNHFKALEGLARILRDTGQKKSALQAYKQILKINPFQEGAKQAVEELSLEVEGQGI
jgi:tetratricopeptide (TPR) repeat protein